MQAAPIKTGILSFGMSGKVFHAPFLHAHPGFDLVAVTERSAKKAAEIYPSIVSYDSVEALLADPTLELVVVNTPNYTHFELGMKALKAGKHVLMEKPFASNVSEVAALFAEAKRQGLCLLPYQNRRYDTDFRSVQEVVESGVLGRLSEVHVRFDRFRPEIGPKVFKETQVPGSGLAFDLGPHLLDQVLSTFGFPLRWSKTLGYHRTGTLVDDYMHFHLEYPEGLNVFVSANMVVADVQPAYVLHGAKGSLVKARSDVQERQLVGGMQPTDASYGQEDAGSEGRLTLVESDGIVRSTIGQKRSSYMELFDAAWKTIREGAAFPIREDQILKQLELLE